MLKVLNIGLLALATFTYSSAERFQKRNIKELNDWWQTAVFYQIYPRSFKDANNDGIGDLQGIIEKLPYLQETGITAAWLSPIFKSPQVDQGYDISDYRDIDPIFGTMDDFNELLAKAHELGLKIILDFVPNHTSDQHQWFIDSVSKKEGYEDYYIWVDAKKDENGNNSPPNNWISLFQGSAWTWNEERQQYYLHQFAPAQPDLNYNNPKVVQEMKISLFQGSAWTWNEERQQYYLHQFAPAQPDLNYNNPKVVQEMKDVLTYWMDLGVDGFRVDAVPVLFEDLELRDEPVIDSTDSSYNGLDHIYTKDLNETFDMVYQWRELVDNYVKENGGETRVLMTEAYTTPEKTVLYYGSPDGRLGAHFTFNFNFITNLTASSTAVDIFFLIHDWFALTKDIYTPNWVIGNHDNHRVASRLGPENVDGFNMLLAMLFGIQVTYNGEEIGQEDGEVTCEEGMDPSAIKNCTTFNSVSRDFERTPFQWDSSVNAGFNDGAKPWLPVSMKANETNLAAQNVDGLISHYNNYKGILEIRKQFHNDFYEFGASGFEIVNALRETKDGFIGLIFNIGSNTLNYTTTDSTYEVILTSVNSNKKIGDIIGNGTISLGPHESIIYKSGADPYFY